MWSGVRINNQRFNSLVTTQLLYRLPKWFPTTDDLWVHVHKHAPSYQSPTAVLEIHKEEPHQIQKIDISQSWRVSMAMVSRFEYIARNLIDSVSKFQKGEKRTNPCDQIILGCIYHPFWLLVKNLQEARWFGPCDHRLCWTTLLALEDQKDTLQSTIQTPEARDW